MEDKTDIKGAFMESLVRTNRDIRRDRAMSIAENAELHFKRDAEDLGIQLTQMKRDRENLLDLSPTNAQNLTMASDFNAKDFVAKYNGLGVKIRELQIKYDIAKESYDRLFTEMVEREEE